MPHGLLKGYAGYKDSPTIPPRFRYVRPRQALERIVQLYETWDRFAPGTGKAKRAAEWRARLVNLEQTSTSGPVP